MATIASACSGEPHPTQKRAFDAEDRSSKRQKVSSLPSDILPRETVPVREMLEPRSAPETQDDYPEWGRTLTRGATRVRPPAKRAASTSFADRDNDKSNDEGDIMSRSPSQQRSPETLSAEWAKFLKAEVYRDWDGTSCNIPQTAGVEKILRTVEFLPLSLKASRYTVSFSSLSNLISDSRLLTIRQKLSNRPRSGVRGLFQAESATTPRLPLRLLMSYKVHSRTLSRFETRRYTVRRTSKM